MLILGNCVEKLKELPNSSVDLIYLDPPFFSQKTHALKTRDNSKEFAFGDTWESLTEYLTFIGEGLQQAKRLLKPSGTIFLHCDRAATHHLRLQLDVVFGSENFQSEIIWAYRRWSNAKKGLLNAHQTIYFYSKTDDFYFNNLYTDYSPTTNVDQILQERARDENGRAVYKRNHNGTVVLGGEKKGVPLSDVWNIPFLNPKAHERVGYPTQKPILLLEQIIKLATKEGDTVLDPFCGSGTTLVAAKLLNRQYIGIDVSPDAMQLSQSRLEQLIKTKSFLLEKGEADYLEKTDLELNILKLLEAVPVQRNKGIDGFVWVDHQESPLAVRIQKPYESLQEAKQKLIAAAKTKNCTQMILIRTNALAEMTFFDVEENIDNLLILDSYTYAIDKWLKTQVLS